MKLHVVRPATLLESDSSACVFLKILRNFEKYLFCRTPPDIPDYNIEQTPAESNGGGAVMYISQQLSYKPCKYLQIYSPKEFNISPFNFKIPNNQIIWRKHKHPPMQHSLNYSPNMSHWKISNIKTYSEAAAGRVL